MRVLLVEDDSATAQSIELMLKFGLAVIEDKIKGLGIGADDYLTALRSFAKKLMQTTPFKLVAVVEREFPKLRVRLPSPAPFHQ